MSKNSCKAAESIEDAVHDNRMFAKRTFYCIANGACELYRFRMYPSGYHSGSTPQRSGRLPRRRNPT